MKDLKKHQDLLRFLAWCQVKIPVTKESIKVFLGHASVQTTQIYAESPQATVDKHIREWNERNFPRSIYIDEKDLEKRNVPDFLKRR